MLSLLLWILSVLQLLSSLKNPVQVGEPEEYVELPRFWSNVGLCPAGDINHDSLTASLLSDAMQMNLRQIGALPAAAVKYVRVHWLLELSEFIAYTQAGQPIFDFTQLDVFLSNLQDYGLYPVIEFMCNLGNIFLQNPTRNALLWEIFAYETVKHMLDVHGAKNVQHWRFESWNEPDSLTYNKLNFSFATYLDYALALRRGLTAAAHHVSHNLELSLAGPAGLFKAEHKHPLCWQILSHCNQHIKQCPFHTLTYHRKGDGHASTLLADSSQLLKTIYQKFPKLLDLYIANDEADPIVNWSRAQEFHADVNYAWLLINIVLEHWSGKLVKQEFQRFEYLSHDNAFLSYYPHEFTQRTLLAHFRMNNSNTELVHSQFIQKPVYVALGLLARLAALATNVELLQLPQNSQLFLKLLKSRARQETPMQISWLLVPADNATSANWHNLSFNKTLVLLQSQANEQFAMGIDLMANQLTDPYFVWQQYGSPAYPNAKVREAMRRAQYPLLHDYGILQQPNLQITLPNMSGPFVMLIRVCSNLLATAKAPHSLMVARVTAGEVFVHWQEHEATNICLKTYELWFNNNYTSNEHAWSFISATWHLPFPSFHYAPANKVVSGFYKVRSQNLFNNYSAFSTAYEYFEV